MAASKPPRATDTEQVRVLFEEIGKQVEAAGAELQDFSALGARGDRDDGRAARESRVHVAAVRDAVAALVVAPRLVEQRVGRDAQAPAASRSGRRTGSAGRPGGA